MGNPSHRRNHRRWSFLKHYFATRLFQSCYRQAPRRSGCRFLASVTGQQLPSRLIPALGRPLPSFQRVAEQFLLDVAGLPDKFLQFLDTACVAHLLTHGSRKDVGITKRPLDQRCQPANEIGTLRRGLRGRGLNGGEWTGEPPPTRA